MRASTVLIFVFGPRPLLIPRAANHKTGSQDTLQPTQL